MPISVAIVEDDAEIREGLERTIAKAKQFSYLKAYANGEEALAELPRLAPNVVIMDIRLPGMDGVECTRRLKKILPATQVLILTVFMEIDQIVNALKAGASGYILKRTSRVELLQALEQVWEGGAPMSGEIARKVVESFRQPQQAELIEGKLTPREEEVLRSLAMGNGSKEIAEQLNVSLDTVKFHLKNIYTKLHVRSRTEAVAKFLR